MQVKSCRSTMDLKPERVKFDHEKHLPLTSYISGSFLHMALILKQSSLKICKRGCAEIQQRQPSESFVLHGLEVGQVRSDL